MVVRVYLKQAWNLMKQNPLFSTLYIVGTGISIVMTMVIAIEEFYKLKYCSTVVYMVPRA